LEIKPGASVELRGARAPGDTLMLVTSLANSVAVKQGTVVARLRIFTNDGPVLERTLRAGLDTAEWAHERADVRASVQHELAPVFSSSAGDAAESFQAFRYLARVPLSANVSMSRVEIENVAPSATLVLWKASLYDARSQQSTFLTNELDVAALDPARWQTAAEMDGVLILRNLRACPRAWLVSEAEAVDGEAALSRIRGTGAREFDPRRTVLLEVEPRALPQLSGGAIADDNAARIVVYEPNRLTIETSAAVPSVLVVSEMFYPGWVATVDGRAARIDVADYLLRGVALPAGRHRVEMRYVAPAARVGAAISLLTLLALGGLGFYAARPRKR
jgi:Bacterial membrane protein YfhO